MTASLVVWDDALLGYDLGDHPLDPVRVELTIALARALGVLDRPGVRVEAPTPATDATLLRVHTAEYITAIKEASAGRRASGYGLGTSDNPVFPGIHETSALIAGATCQAAEAVWTGAAQHAVSIAGGLHHAMPDRASGFCVYNDPAIAIARLLDLGAERVAYIDVDVHHGDGVQAIFYDDPRVLTVSLHESPRSLFPGTGYPSETGGPGAEGTAVNIALPVGTDDAAWLRAYHAVVPSVTRAFRPQVLFTQCGADAYRTDPLANLQLTVDGQRAIYLALRALADEVCDGRWVATGGGGYALVECVPRAWTHLLAIATGEPIEPTTATPPAWQELARLRRPQHRTPTSMTDGVDPVYQPWDPGGDGAGADGAGHDGARHDGAIDRAVLATRRAVFPLLGLDPYDPRD